jgi:hypothetical protein
MQAYAKRSGKTVTLAVFFVVVEVLSIVFWSTSDVDKTLDRA